MNEIRQPYWRTEARDSDNIRCMDNAEGFNSCSRQRLRKTDIGIKDIMSHPRWRVALSQASEFGLTW
jgi:hypothetical protein